MKIGLYIALSLWFAIVGCATVVPNGESPGGEGVVTPAGEAAVGVETTVGPTETTEPESAADDAEPASDVPTSTGVWEERAPLLEANSEMAVAQLDETLYVLGGYPSSRQTVSTVQIYDAATDSWRFGAPLPVGSNHAAAAAVDGTVYIIGGQPTSSGGGPFLQDVYAYDPASDTWSQRADMPTWRGGQAAAVVDGKIYVAGGRPPHGHDFAVYDPAADAWTVLPEMPTARNHFALLAHDGLLYAIGGRFGAGFASEVTDIVEIYNPQTESWSTGTPMPTPRSGHNAIVANGCLHVLGGEGHGPGNVNGLYPQHEVYDPTTDTWTSLAPMPTPVHGVVGMAFIDGWIHFPGGGVQQGGSSGSTMHQVYSVGMGCE